MPQSLVQTGEALLRAWLQLTGILWNRQMVSGMTFNEAVVCNLLSHRQTLEDSPAITASILCKETNIKKSQMNQILTTLERNGYLLRERSEADHRKVFLSLTPAGETAYREAHQCATEMLAVVVDKLGLETAALLTDKINLASKAALEHLQQRSEKGSI